MMRVQMVLGSAQRALCQHQPFVVPRYLDLFLGSTNDHGDTVAVRERLLEKGWGQPHLFGNLDTVQIIPTPVVQRTVVPQPDIFHQNLVGLGIDTKMTNLEGVMCRHLGDF